jgi:hypothetical protein
MGVLRFSVALALSISLPLHVQWLDKRRLPSRQRERAWNAASWGAALYAFGPLSMLGWAWVTRRSAVALVGALLVAVSMFLVMDAVDAGIARLAGGDEVPVVVELF